MPNHMVISNWPMVYCVPFVSVALMKCLVLNLVSNSVVNSGWDFECAIYYWSNDICGMELAEFEQHSAVSVDYDFDLLNARQAVVSSYYADDDSVMVLGLMKPLVVYYMAEQCPSHWLIAVISIGLTHYQIGTPARGK